MKRMWIIGAIISLAFLAACSGVEQATEIPDTAVQEATQVPDVGGTTSTDEIAKREFQVSDQATLIMGTFMLEETDLAVTPEQASELAFLWKAVRSLAESDSATLEEQEALIDQIQDSMTQEQLAAMQVEEFSQDDIRVMMENLGFGINQMAEGSVDGSAEGGDSTGRQRPEGMEGMQPGMGGGPGGGMGGGEMGDIDPEVMETMQAQRAERTGGGDRISLLMLDPLIELLERRAQG